MGKKIGHTKNNVLLLYIVIDKVYSTKIKTSGLVAE